MTRTFPHRNLLTIAPLAVADIDNIFALAEHYLAQSRSPAQKSTRLNGKTIVNLFFEPSTRTRTSFEIAAKRLGADVVNIAIEHSSTRKGETLLDTALNLDAMQISALIIRHAEGGTPVKIAEHMKASVINAGDGTNEHPTQALLDALTIRRRKGKLKDLKIAICGDLAHSRVARSNIQLLNKYGAEIRVVAPMGFMPTSFDGMQIKRFDNLEEGLRDVDVAMMLRIQHERLTANEFAMSLKEYHERYGLDHAKLSAAKPDVLVMHPGPVNRGVEITSKLADDTKYSAIREQVETGVAVRMAVLDLLLG